MYYGVQYYPEHWPEERWLVDADMMKRAGVNVVRMGEFAWSAYEPLEGQLDFSWMERAIKLLGNHNIKTILCTCSRTPPPWVYQRFPGILSVGPEGLTSHTDARYAVGLAHPDFITLSQRIDAAVVNHFAGDENVVAWQIDNEVGARNDCYCEVCLKAFHTYLEDKYGTPEALNKAWGFNFWSFRFNNFSEVPKPGTQPQLTLEYRRFMSLLNVEFTRWRADLIHKLDPGKPVTTNFQNIRASHTDCHHFSTVIDVNGMNHYPSRTPELALDYYRGNRGTVWAVEQHTRLQPMDTPEGWMRLWAWMAVAHGANAVIFFRWRQCRWGQEQFADGLLPHSGQENRFYRELIRMGDEIKKAGEWLDTTKPYAQVAIIYSNESRWALKAGRFGPEFDPVEEAVEYHRSLAQWLPAIDAMDPREDLSQYKLVIAPRLWIVDNQITQNLHRYVLNGGTLVLTPGSGVADKYGKSFNEPRPGPLRKMTGINVSDLAFQKGLVFSLESEIIPELSNASGHDAADEIHLEGAEIIAQFADGWRKGLPAITMNQYGLGRVIYMGTIVNSSTLDHVIRWLCDISGVVKDITSPQEMSIYERQSPKIRLKFIINWSDEKQQWNAGKGWREIFTGKSVKEIDVPAGDLMILYARRISQN